MNKANTINFKELKDKMKVRVVHPWWSPNFLLATVSKSENGFYIELNRKVQQNEVQFFVKDQIGLDANYFVVSDENYKKENNSAYDNAIEHSKYLLILTGKKSWDEYWFSD